MCGALDAHGCTAHVLQLGNRVPCAEGRIGMTTFSHLPTGRLWSLHGIRRIFQVHRLIRRERYDAVLSYFESADLIATIAGMLSGVSARVSSRRDTGFRYGPGMRLAYRVINPRFRSIIAVSDAVMDSLREQGIPDSRIHRIHNGVDPVRFDGEKDSGLRVELGIETGEPVIVMVANLNPVKDHATALAAIDALHRSGCHPHLVVAGEGPLRERLKEKARQLGLEKWTHFIGRRDDVSPVLKAGDLFLLCSHTEGLSNAVLEAMAARMPVVATRVGGNPEVVVDGETGFLVAAGDTEGIAGALEKLIHDPVLREKMGLAGWRRVVEEFSLDRMVRAYVGVMCDATRRSV
ncbi:MAG: glycosyltransferase [Nitrospirota bacterium]|nr:glycosyltransferase [Nitrospirota bacterium]